MQRRGFIKTLGLAGCCGFGLDAWAGAPQAVKGKAKSVIQIWLGGGPSSLETFDPKPAADKEYNNGMKAIPTNVPGMQLFEEFPKLAQQADKFSLIRTLTHPYNGHEVATYVMQTGRAPGGHVYPAIGTVISSMKAKEYHGEIAPYVILTRSEGRFSEIGFLGEKHAPFVTGGNPSAKRFAVDCIVPPDDVSPERLQQRFALLDKLDTFGRAAPQGEPETAAFKKAGEDAKQIIGGHAAETFDLDKETAATRDLYGRTVVGQSLLAARRLVEGGVPYITVNMGGWDTHKKHFEAVRRLNLELDAGIAALLQDLAQRKLLDTTIVWCTGEFGRTPRIQREAPWNGGRGHFAQCFSVLVAGGGFAGGRVLGESDETASKPVKRPVAPQDLLGGICELCGIDPDGPLPNSAGIKTNILPPASELGRVRELYA